MINFELTKDNSFDVRKSTIHAGLLPEQRFKHISKIGTFVWTVGGRYFRPARGSGNTPKVQILTGLTRF